jgi:hypothetical protein
MITAYHLADAAPAAIFGMIALWAASSKRHWFVRTAVVSAAVLASLLIPAFDVAISLGIQSLLVVTSLAVWRKRRLRLGESQPAKPAPALALRPRMSLATMLLLVVIVVVATAVAARSPRITARQWYDLSVGAVMASGAYLSCVWIVCGRASWVVRVLAAPLVAFVLGLAMHGFKWAASIVHTWFRGTRPLSQYWQIVLNDTWSGGLYWVTTVGLSIAVLCAWLYLLRRAGWFDPFDEPVSRPPATDRAWRHMALARCTAVLFLIIVSLFPLALFYRLIRPTPIPVVKLPEPNGFDDFVAAGRMIGPVDGTKLARWDLLSDGQLKALSVTHAAAIDRMRLGLERECWHPYGFVPRTTDDEVTIGHLISALAARGKLADRSGSVEERLAAYLDWLRVCVESDRGTGTTYSIPAQLEGGAVRGLANCLTQLSAQQCIELAADLWKLEASRETWQIRAKRQRIIDENIDWQWRLQAILADWSATERYQWVRLAQLRRMAEVRILIAELGIRAHKLDTGKVPATLAVLVPKYLPAVPDDSYDNGAIKYGVSANGYMLYSIGADGDDDRGRPIVSRLGVENGDLTSADLLPISAGGDPARMDADETNGADNRTTVDAAEKVLVEHEE